MVTVERKLDLVKDNQFDPKRLADRSFIVEVRLTAQADQEESGAVPCWLPWRGESCWQLCRIVKL